jgi:hypothetical protein
MAGCHLLTTPVKPQTCKRTRMSWSMLRNCDGWKNRGYWECLLAGQASDDTAVQ